MSAVNLAGTLTRDGCSIPYRVRGEGPPVVITPGGRASMEATKPLADLFTSRYTVVEWDRRNCGRAGVWAGEASEQLTWADDLAELLTMLGLAPAYLAGGSAGSRVSYLAALRHPEIVRGMVLWSVSGGPYSSQILGYQNHTVYINAAIRGGMEAVVATDHFARLVDANPANRSRLLAMDPERFIAALRSWNEFFFWRAETPAIGATRADLETIRCPALVFEGNDDMHPPSAAEAVYQSLANAEWAPSPWTRDEWMHRWVGRVPGTVFDLYPRLWPRIDQFLSSVSAV
jgi:pimeloyl-ACP methyl ester carboxylesterase